MQLLSTLSGWQWLVAGAVPLGILALYFLKLRRKPLEVPSTFFWKKSIEDLHVNALWQRIRQSILLFLQLAAVAFLIVALLRPTVNATNEGRQVIFLVDQSASMAATDVAPSRLEAAKQKALEILGQFHDGDAAMVIAFADTARVLCSYTQNVQEIRRAILAIEQSSGTTDPHEALSIASGLANPQRAGEEDAAAIPATVYLLSDGNFPDISDIALGNLTLNFLSVGKAGENVAVVSMGGRRSEDAPDRHQILANIRNFGEREVKTAVELVVDGVSKDIQSVDLAPGETQAVMFRLAVAESAAIGVRLDHEDDLVLDNAAWTVVNPPRPIRMLIVGPDNPALDAALATPAVASIATMERRPADFAGKDFADETQVGAFDLVLFDRCAPSTMPNANTLFLGSLPPALAHLEKDEVQNPILLNWKSTHPLLRFLVLDDVTILNAFTVPLPPGTDRLMECDKGTVLFSLPRGVYSDVVQTFPLIGEDGTWRTDWPLKLSFPLYVMNLIRVLGGAEGEGRTAYQPGEIVNLRGEESVRSATVTYPDGRSVKIQRSSQGNFTFVDTGALGVYRITMGSREQRFVVNLCSESESAIRPSEKVSIGAVQAADVSGEFQSRYELWRWLALLAFLVLVFEWYVYNRRVYI